LQQIEGLNTSFARVLESVQRSYASSLLGKEVSFQTRATDGTVAVETGAVEEVTIGGDGELLLTIGGEQVKLADVIAIRD
jgi:flagellar hook assembly protein FlgD